MILEHQLQPGCLFCNPFFAESLFGDLAPDDLAALDRIKKSREFPADTEIFAAGCKTPGIYILARGCAQVILQPDGLPEATHLCSWRPALAGELFGLRESLADTPSRITLLSVTPCLFEFIEAPDFDRFLLERAEVCFQLLQKFSRNLQKNCRPVSSKIL
jgi:CRP-like cAMP-binding protein